MGVPAPGLVDGVERIAVLRANALGDYIATLPALYALRAAYQQAEIVLLGAPWHARFLTGRPGPVDRVLVVPALDGIREPEPGETRLDLDRFFADTRRERFDLAVQLHGGGRNSNPIVNGLGAKVSTGLRAPDAEPLDRWIRYLYQQPEVFRHLEVVALVGAEPVTFAPHLTVTDDDRAQALQVAGPPAGTRVALHPGARDPRRRWPADRFAALAGMLLERGYEVVITGTAPERDLAEQIALASGGRAQVLAGRVSLGGLLGVLSDCAAVIGNDSGPLYAAAALGIPTVGVYWIGNMINYASPLRGRNRPLASWTVHCPVCGTDNSARGMYSGTERAGVGCGHRASFVAEVPVDEVLEAALDLLEPADSGIAGPFSAQGLVAGLVTAADPAHRPGVDPRPAPDAGPGCDR